MLKNFYHPQSISGKQHTTPNAKAQQTQQENVMDVSGQTQTFYNAIFSDNLGSTFQKPIIGGGHNLKYQLHSRLLKHWKGHVCPALPPCIYPSCHLGLCLLIQ